VAWAAWVSKAAFIEIAEQKATSPGGLLFGDLRRVLLLKACSDTQRIE
jgi:hypothetical protein